MTMITLRDNKRKQKNHGMYKRVEWYKVKEGKMEKINKPKNINKSLNEGYSVSRVETKGNKTKIKTYSPSTYENYKKRGGV